ncbi:MAG: RNA polymerase sigma factor [Planctomycetes bacterium]|nr:RNA polymerase sigma factor [Planctomycetota bacterium]
MASSDDKLSHELTSYREPIYRYVLSMVRDAAEAEDLTQETFLRAHAKLSTLDDLARLSPWLYRIATNVCYDRFRQASYRNRAKSLDAAAEGDTEAGRTEALADPTPRLDQIMEQKEMSTCVQQYLVGLSDSYRAVILLHDVEGLTNPEISQMLGASLSTIKIRLHRAREKLRAALSEGCLFTIDERGVFVCEPNTTAQGHGHLQ